MLFRHMREELAAARDRDLSLAENLKARNAILIATAAIAPFTAAMWIALLLTWKHVGDPPALMSDAALAYPVAALATALSALPLHRRRHYFLATALVLLPLVAVAAFLVGAVAWAAGWRLA